MQGKEKFQVFILSLWFLRVAQVYWRVAPVSLRRVGRSLLAARRAGRNGAARRSSRFNTGCFGLLRVAQIHVARRAPSSVHHARC
ncbi:hypothetical protein A2U01_0076030, partial [Trifolium medium]|nr:hypothetical protein [Trifolium medium]